MRRWGIIAALLLILPGCFLNPYNSEFKCPRSDNGQCLSVSTAYEESLNEKSDSHAAPDSKKNPDAVNEKDTYQRELFRKLSALIQEPTTPIVAPSVAMRGLALTFVGDENELYSYQYVYFFVDSPSWVLGDYLNAGIGEGK